jgi:hypothetical protein
MNWFTTLTLTLTLDKDIYIAINSSKQNTFLNNIYKKII